MDAPCNHRFIPLGDEIVCQYCTWYPNEKRNEYVREQHKKEHSNWHSYAGQRPERRGNFFRGGHSMVRTIPDDILFNTPIPVLAKLYDVTRSPIDKERRRRRNV